MTALANVYLFGERVTRDASRAAAWYRKAAKFGCLHFIFNLASGIEAKHFEPNSIEELSDLTFALFERAKELPHHIQIGLPKYPSN